MCKGGYSAYTINNWPDLLEHCKVQDIKGVLYTDDEIVQMREKFINTFSSIGKDTYIPLGGGGSSLNGTNIEHFLFATHLIKEIRKIEELIIGIEDSIREELSKTAPDLPDNLDFHLCLEESGFVIKEINTDVPYLLNDFCGLCYLAMMLNQKSTFPNVQTRRGGNVA